jgi:hypothetical protein
MAASPHLIGIGSGIVAAVLFASLATNTLLATMLFYVTPLPLLLARLGWGRAAGQLAFVTATILVGFILSYKTAVFYGVTLGLPALMLGHFALLHREMIPEDAEGRPLRDMPAVVQWYPPGHIIAWSAVIAGALIACGILLLAGDAETYHRAVKKAFEDIILPQVQSSGMPIDTLRAERYISLISRLLLPAIGAIAWMFVMLMNLWLAGKSTSISALLPRPWPRFANLEFPPLMTVGFVASVGIALLPGMPGVLAMAFIGAFGFAYLLLGLVVLHQVVADSPFKPLFLAGLYLGILLIDWGAVAVAVIGLAEPLFELRQRALKRSAPPPKSGKT